MGVTLDTSDLKRTLDQVRARLESLAAGASGGQILDDIGEILESSTQERFETKQAPDGKSWPAWRDSRYAARQAARGKSLLLDEGDLRGGITHQVDREGVDVGTRDVRAATHQYGDTRTAWGRVTATWEPRPFLGLSPEDEDDIIVTVEDWVRRELAA